jgi:hypothetical protein
MGMREVVYLLIGGVFIVGQGLKQEGGTLQRKRAWPKIVNGIHGTQASVCGDSKRRGQRARIKGIAAKVKTSCSPVINGDRRVKGRSKGRKNKDNGG